MNPFDMPQSLRAATVYFADEQAAHDFLSEIRWPSGVHCPHCQSKSIGKLSVTTVPSRSKDPKAKPSVRRLWVCKDCRKQFTVKTGTIFEESALSLSLWLPGVWMIVSAKNGISSCELARALDVSQKSAWFMLHRIRTAMAQGDFPLRGTVEADEVFLGGSLTNMKGKKRASIANKAGAGHMTPVLGMIQRTTENELSKVVLKILPNTKRRSIFPHILKRVEQGSTVYTDALRSYNGLDLAYIHETVDHAVEYVRGSVHTNGLENFWSVLKRTIHGTYVSVSPKHIIRYLDEQATRFNERHTSDLGRFLATLRRVSGRRLTYEALTAEPDARALGR